MESPADFYDCIHRACQLKEDKFEEFGIIVLQDNTDVLRFFARLQAENELMHIRLELSDIREILPSQLLWEMEIHDILNSTQEAMCSNLFPIFVYMFLGLFIHSLRFEDDLRAACKNSGMQAEIGEFATFKRVFNFLFSAMCSFLFASLKGQNLVYLNRNGDEKFPQILSEAQKEVLLIMGPSRTHRFMRFLAPLRPFNDEKALTISYNTNIEDFLRIESYSPLVSLEKTRESRKPNSADRFYLLNSLFQFQYIVNVRHHFIEVCMRMDNVRCNVLQYHPNFKAEILSGDVPDKRYHPTKICLRFGPEHGHGVQCVSLSASTPTIRARNIGKEKTKKILNWNFDMSCVNCSDAKMDWTLYDSTTGKPVHDNIPSKFSILRDKAPSLNKALTDKGGVLFGKEEYGNPITWRLNKGLEGQVLKFVVQASLWLTYKPNSRYSETLRHDFCQVADLKLEATSTDLYT